MQRAESEQEGRIGCDSSCPTILLMGGLMLQVADSVQLIRAALNADFSSFENPIF